MTETAAAFWVDVAPWIVAAVVAYAAAVAVLVVVILFLGGWLADRHAPRIADPRERLGRDERLARDVLHPSPRLVDVVPRDRRVEREDARS